MNRTEKTVLTLLFAVAAHGNSAFAVERGRGGMALFDNVQMDWHSSLGAAKSWAQRENGPVMLVVHKGTPEETRAIDKMGSWPQSIELSKNKMAAIKLKAGDRDADEAMNMLKLKPPAVAFLDKYGNPLIGMPIPEQVTSISQVVAGWKTVAGNIDTFFKDHQSRGERYLQSGKLKHAYLEFSYGAPFKGPDAEKMRSGQQKIEEQWLKLLEIGAKLPGIAQSAIFKGLRKDTLGTTYAAAMEKYVTDPSSAVAGRGPSSSVAAAPMVTKSLAEVARSSVSVSAREETEDTGLDTGILGRSENPKLKQAEKILQEGIVDYKKATAESSDRGPERNKLLQNARAKFEQTLTLCEEAQKTKSDPGIDKLMEKTSMLMYGALKYQSL